MMVRNLFPGGNQTPTQFCRKSGLLRKSVLLLGLRWVLGTLFSQHFPNIFPTKYGFGTVYVFLGYPPKTQQNPTLCWKNVGFRVRFFVSCSGHLFFGAQDSAQGSGRFPLNSENPAALIAFPDPNRTPTPRFCTRKARKKTIRTEISARIDR